MRTMLYPQKWSRYTRSFQIQKLEPDATTILTGNDTAIDSFRITQKGVADAIKEHLVAFQTLDPRAQIGFRASLARGRKGPHKGGAPFDSSDFDVDAFLVRDELVGQFPKRD